MRAAGIRFAEGCYQNEIAYTLSERGTLKFGLKSDTGGNDNWCCFDNFALYYQPTPDFYDGIKPVHSSQSIVHNEVYDLSGRKVNGRSKKGIVIRDGKKMLVK